jgi:hypothetical protein
MIQRWDSVESNPVLKNNIEYSMSVLVLKSMEFQYFLPKDNIDLICSI